MKVSRRAFLGGTAVCVGGAAAWLALGNRSRRERVSLGSPRFREILDDLLDSERQQVLSRAAHHVEQGVGVDWLLAVAFLGPIVRNAWHEDVHAQLVVPAARHLWLTERGTERWLPVFFSLDYSNDWVRVAGMPSPRASQRAASSGDPQGELLRATILNDVERAERASLSVYQKHGARKLIDELLLCSMTRFNDPHRALYVAQAFRALDAFGWDLGEDVVRSLGHWVARRGPAVSADEDPTASFERNRERVRAGLAAGVAPRRYEAGAVGELASMIRQAQPDSASDLAAELLGKGVPERVLWDAVTLTAVESACAERTESGIGVHAVTLTGAVRGCSTALGRETRLTILLQAVAWAAHRHWELPATTIRLASITAADSPQSGPEALLEATSGDPANAISAALAWIRAHGASPLEAVTRTSFLRRGIELHQFKLIAGLDEAAVAVDTRFHDVIVASAAALMPPDYRWERHDEAMELAARLGRRG